jgi:hypothetical protein
MAIIFRLHNTLEGRHTTKDANLCIHGKDLRVVFVLLDMILSWCSTSEKHNRSYILIIGAIQRLTKCYSLFVTYSRGSISMIYVNHYNTNYFSSRMDADDEHGAGDVSPTYYTLICEIISSSNPAPSETKRK